MTNAAPPQRRFAGAKVLVTGGASGLGYACSQRFAAEGAQVTVADLDEGKAADAAAAIATQTEAEVGALYLDVTDPEAWNRAKEVLETGGLDVLVNNAGIGTMGSVEDTGPDDLRRTMAVNVEGPFYGCQALLPLLKKSARGSIVNMSSVAGIIAAGNMAAYNASKAAIRHLSKSVALHCAERGYPVTCNSVHPAFVKTPILDPLEGKYGADIFDKLARQIPIGRLGLPEEVAAAVAFLSSEEARFITGAELVLDGGLSAG